MASLPNVRDDFRYTKEHEWLSEGNGEQLVGVSAFAVEQLGDITLVNIDVKVGDTVTVGKAIGTVESVKTLSDVYAPISGRVARVNGELESRPELLNEDPYGTWIIAIEPAGAEGDLMDAAAYRTYLTTTAHLTRRRVARALDLAFSPFGTMVGRSARRAAKGL